MEDISLHILDIAENSITAGATLIKIGLTDRRDDNCFIVEVEDNGRGMDRDLATRAIDPFFTSRTTRHVGLGLPLLAQAARETGGDISVKSTPGIGTTVTAFFKPAHIDMKPLGNIQETLLVLIAGNPERDFVFTYVYDIDREPFTFDTREIRVDLEGIAINAPEVLTVLRQRLKESFDEIKNKVV